MEQLVKVGETVRHRLAASDGMVLSYELSWPSEPAAIMIVIHGTERAGGSVREATQKLCQQQILVLEIDSQARKQYNKHYSYDPSFVERQVQDIKELRNAHVAQWGRLPVYVTGIKSGTAIAMSYAKSITKECAGIAVYGPPFGPCSATQHFNSRQRELSAALVVVDSLLDIENNMGMLKIPLMLVYESSDRLASIDQLETLRENWGTDRCTIMLQAGSRDDISRVLAEYVRWVADLASGNQHAPGGPLGHGLMV